MLFSDDSDSDENIIQQNTVDSNKLSSSFEQPNFRIELNVSKDFEESKLINSPMFTKSHMSNNIDEANISVNDIIHDNA